MPRAKIGDVHINYVVEGTGDWLVLIGGYASGHWQSWQKYLARLTNRYRVLAFDSRGNGASDAPDYPYTVAMMAADTIGLMEHVGIERARIIGRSLGGSIAQEIALQRPRLVQRLAMTSTFARLGQRGKVLVDHWIDTVTHIGFPRFFEYLMTYFFTAEFYAQNYAEVQKAVAALCDTPRSVAAFANTGHAVKNHDVLERLGDIRTPALLLCGAEDVITPARHTEEMGRRMPNASVHIVPRTGHGFLIERPESFDLILQFLEQH